MVFKGVGTCYLWTEPVVSPPGDLHPVNKLSFDFHIKDQARLLCSNANHETLKPFRAIKKKDADGN